MRILHSDQCTLPPHPFLSLSVPVSVQHLLPPPPLPFPPPPPLPSPPPPLLPSSPPPPFPSPPPSLQKVYRLRLLPDSSLLSPSLPHHHSIPPFPTVPPHNHQLRSKSMSPQFPLYTPLFSQLHLQYSLAPDYGLLSQLPHFRNLSSFHPASALLPPSHHPPSLYHLHTPHTHFSTPNHHLQNCSNHPNLVSPLPQASKQHS